MKQHLAAVLDEILEEILPPRRRRSVKRGVKRKQNKYPVRRREDQCRRVEAPTILLRVPEQSK